MLRALLFPGVGGICVERVWWDGRGWRVAAHTTKRSARCPVCGHRSSQVQSRYTRTLADLACGDAPVTVLLTSRRFTCRMPTCQRRIFTECLPDLMAPRARRTQRLQRRLEQTGFVLGSAPGVRYLRAQGLVVSVRTLLRIVRAAPPPTAGPVRVLGVDDWSQRKGQTFGSILVDLETHRVIDLLPDRTAATFAHWLADHPEVEIISRDRAGAYADGARQGAPQAIQVADHFHLLKNVTEALERFLARNQAALRQASTAAAQSVTGPHELDAPLPPAPTPVTADQCLQQERRLRRVARYEEILALHAQGHGIREIGRLLGIARHTVRRFLRTEGYPERQPRRPCTAQIAPFDPYLRARWAEGCQNAAQLWREIWLQGFAGGRTSVKDYVRSWRTEPRRPNSAPHQAPAHQYAPRETCWLLLRPAASLTADQQAFVTYLYHTCPQIAVAEALVEEFSAVFEDHDLANLDVWLHRAEASGIADLANVARNMRSDRLAIEAAVVLDWSNGQVEGQVNRLKVIKRDMYGRARFDLLRQRVLHAA